MFREKMGNEYLVVQDGTSEGTQIKYRKGEYWYKKDRRGREGLAEYLVSGLLAYSDLKEDEYAVYESGYINDSPGCRSKNFLKDGEELVTFYRLYYNEFGKDLSKILAVIERMEERIEFVVQFIWQMCGLDVTDYLKKIFTLDMDSARKWLEKEEISKEREVLLFQLERYLFLDLKETSKLLSSR